MGGNGRSHGPEGGGNSPVKKKFRGDFASRSERGDIAAQNRGRGTSPRGVRLPERGRGGK